MTTSSPPTNPTAGSSEDSLESLSNSALTFDTFVLANFSMEEMSGGTVLADGNEPSGLSVDDLPSAEYPSVKDGVSQTSKATHSKESAQEEASKASSEESIECDLQTGILHAIKVNDAMSRTVSFNVSSSTKSRTEMMPPQKIKGRVCSMGPGLHGTKNKHTSFSQGIGRVRSMGPALLSSNSNGSKQTNEPQRKQQLDAASNGDDRLDDSGVLHAIKVDDELSQTVSFNVLSNTNSRTEMMPPQKIKGRVRSMGPGLHGTKNKHTSFPQGIGRVRSMGPALLSSNSNGSKQTNEPQLKQQEDAATNDDDRLDDSGVLHAVKVNDVSSRTVSFNVSSSTKSRSEMMPSQKIKGRVRSMGPGLHGTKNKHTSFPKGIGRVRSMGPALLSSNSNGSKQTNEPQLKQQEDASTNDDDHLDDSGVLHAVKVNDVSSRTVSFNVSSSTKNKSAMMPPQKIKGRVRSMGPGLRGTKNKHTSFPQGMSRVRSVGPTLLSSNSNGSKQTKELQLKQQGNATANDYDRLDDSGVLHAIKVDDAMSRTVSFNVSSNTKSRSVMMPLQNIKGRVRSLGPGYGFSSIDEETKQKDAPQKKKQDIAPVNNGDDESENLGILHAMKVNDASSLAGSFNVSHKTKKKDSSSSKKGFFGRVRSLDMRLLPSSNSIVSDGLSNSGIPHAIKI